MPQRPIYEAAPLPNEEGAPAITSGLSHSAYQRAKLRQMRDATITDTNLPSYKPKDTVSDSAVVEGIQAAGATAQAVRSHIRKQVLNSRQPGLGAFIGPLPEKVQGVVDAAAEPVVKQVVGYTMKKYRKGTAFTPTTVKPKSSEPKANPNVRVYSDSRTAEPETLTTHSWDAEESRYKSSTIPNPKFNAIAQDISSTHEKIAAKSPTAHPEEIDRALRNYVNKKYGEQTTAAHSARIENHRIDNYNDPKRFDAIASRLGGLHRNRYGTNAAGNQFLSIAVGGSRAPHGLFSASSNDSFPTVFHKIGGNWQNVTHQVLTRRGSTVIADPEDRSDEQEPDTQIGAEPVKKKRSPSDPALTAVARIVAKAHWSSLNGKKAGTVKNALTGELHPTFEQTSHYKNPKAYITKAMGHGNVDQYLLEQHRDLVEAHSGGSTENYLPLERGSGQAQQVPQTNIKNFAALYARNPVGTSLKAGVIKNANKPTTTRTRAAKSMENIASIGSMQVEDRRTGRAARMNAAFNGDGNV